MNKFEKFCYKHEHWGVGNLMLFIAVCNILVYLLASLFPDYGILNWLSFNSTLVMSGQVWRLITFVFIPVDNNPLFLLLACYFYYWMGKVLENEWGKLKFNIFYLTGMLATIIFCMITGSSGTAFYLNLSLFFAYATLFPEQRILLFFILPIKVKYVAIVEAVIFFLLPALDFGVFPQNLIPLVAVLNYILFFNGHIIRLFKRGAVYGKKQADFKSAVRQSQSRPNYQGYTHKCAACGVTDTQDPSIEFRYCSLCAHYECYCSQHIFTHEHIKE